MKKVFHVVGSLGLGGAERVVVEYATSHDRSRYEPEVCCVGDAGPLAAVLDERGVPVHALERRSRLDFRAVLRLAGLIRRRGVDVVHDHNFTAMTVGIPAAILGGATAVLRTEHNVAAARFPFRLALSRLASMRENAQIAVSEAVARSRLAEGRFSPARLVTIRNGIDDTLRPVAGDRAEVRRELGVPDDAVLCLTVGNLSPQKDHENLIRAAAAVSDLVPPVYFAVAGGGPILQHLSDHAAELGVGDRVSFLGSRDDVPRLLRGSDLFVLSSAWEGLPITVLEAMAAGVPCVSTAVGGVPEVIRDGVNGYVVPPRDHEALADKIALLSRDAGRRSRLAAAARRSYEKAFTAKHMVGQTEALYDLALSGHADRAPAGKIKVLYVIGQLERGGAERQLMELATRLPRDRFEPIVCCLGQLGPLGREIEEAGVRLVVLAKRLGNFSGASRKLARLVRTERPVILHAFLSSANWRGLIVGRFLRVPIVLTSVRNVDVHTRFRGNAIERILSGITDRVIVNAGAVKDYVAEMHWVDPEKIRVIYNGISVRRVSGHVDAAPADGNVPSRTGSPPPEPFPGSGAGSGPTITVIASLTPKKDHATFLEAAALIARERPDARFLIVGDGQLRAELTEHARKLGLGEAVTFAGMTDRIGAVLASTDVSVLTSIKEGCSNVVLEAMAAGRPVVATAVGGNPELIEEGETGFLLPAGDAEGVARRVLELLGDEELRRRMGRAGRERVLARFSTEHMVEDTIDYYLELLDERVSGLVGWVDALRAREFDTV
jgi:glycosyltransferase involved in cell wall biosynthesis